MALVFDQVAEDVHIVPGQVGESGHVGELHASVDGPVHGVLLLRRISPLCWTETRHHFCIHLERYPIQQSKDHRGGQGEHDHPDHFVSHQPHLIVRVLNEQDVCVSLTSLW